MTQCDAEVLKAALLQRSRALSSLQWMQVIPTRGYTLFLQSLSGSV